MRKPITKGNKPQNEQTAKPESYPQGFFYDKPCRECNNLFSPKAPSHLYCSEECSDTAHQRNWLKRVYNLTLEEYNEMYEKQNGKCRICETEGFFMNKNQRQSIVIDHCHSTGRVRGLLCHNCNRGLGLFNDKIEYLERAIDYLTVKEET